MNLKNKTYALLFWGSIKDFSSQQIEDIIQKLEILNEFFKQSEVKIFFSHPYINQNIQKDVLIKLLNNLQIAECLNPNILFLLKQRKINILNSIINFLHQKMNQESNRIHVTIISSFSIPKDVLDYIINELKKFFKKDISFKEHIDESIIGGIIVKTDSYKIDLSFKNILKYFEKRLISSYS